MQYLLIKKKSNWNFFEDKRAEFTCIKKLNYVYEFNVTLLRIRLLFINNKLFCYFYINEIFYLYTRREKKQYYFIWNFYNVLSYAYWKFNIYV